MKQQNNNNNKITGNHTDVVVTFGHLYVFSFLNTDVKDIYKVSLYLLRVKYKK